MRSGRGGRAPPRPNSHGATASPPRHRLPVLNCSFLLSRVGGTYADSHSHSLGVVRHRVGRLYAAVATRSHRQRRDRERRRRRLIPPTLALRPTQTGRRAARRFKRLPRFSRSPRGRQRPRPARRARRPAQPGALRPNPSGHTTDARANIVGRWIPCGVPVFSSVPHAAVEFGANGRWQLLTIDATGALVPMAAGTTETRGTYYALGTGQLDVMHDENPNVMSVTLCFVRFGPGRDRLPAGARIPPARLSLPTRA